MTLVMSANPNCPVRVAGVLPLLLILVAGCAASRPADVSASVTSHQADPLYVPADFSVDLTIWAGQSIAEPGLVAAEAHLRPGRFILYCDGSLHWSGRIDHPEDEMPPVRRVLRRGDMSALWTLIRQLGMDEATHATPLENVHLFEPPPEQVSYLVVLTGYGERWAFQRSSSPQTPPDEAIASLVERLAVLAWADVPQAAPKILRRNDFGPDPYARYRR